MTQSISSRMLRFIELSKSKEKKLLQNYISTKKKILIFGFGELMQRFE